MLAITDADPVETGEWIDSLRAVVHHQGRERASFLLDRLSREAQAPTHHAASWYAGSVN